MAYVIHTRDMKNLVSFLEIVRDGNHFSALVELSLSLLFSAQAKPPRVQRKICGFPFLLKSIKILWKVEDEFSGFGECPITGRPEGRGEDKMEGSMRLLSEATRTRDRRCLPGSSQDVRNKARSG